uniref:Uncharacterized protein n=1 Tax=Anopheles funestus TaxID=62324 RepID=A0A182S4B2_ANOFN
MAQPAGHYTCTHQPGLGWTTRFGVIATAAVTLSVDRLGLRLLLVRFFRFPTWAVRWLRSVSRTRWELFRWFRLPGIWCCCELGVRLTRTVGPTVANTCY